MTNKTILAFVVILSAALGEYDITTVYRFNFLEAADENGEIARTYLDTCDVSVHAQSNAIGLPIFDMKRNKSRTTALIYPHKTPSIPTLQEPFENSPWKRLNNSNKKGTLKVTKLCDASEHVPASYVFGENRNIRLIRDALPGISVRDLHGYVTDYNKLFSSDHLQQEKGKINVFLNVQVKEFNARDFKFRLKSSNGKHTIFTVDATSNTISVCQGSCTTYEYKSNDEYNLSLYISVFSKLIIYDGIAQTYLSLGQNAALNSSHSYDGIDQDGNGIGESFYSRQNIKYKLVQICQSVLSDEMTIVAPWMGIKNTTFSILYYREANTELQIHLRYLRSDTVFPQKTSDRILETMKDESDIDNVVNELVLAKVTVDHFQDEPHEKEIKICAGKNMHIVNIWEPEYLDLSNIHETVSKCSKNDGEIFNIAIKDITNVTKADFCANGGIRNYKLNCVCPPGFAGDSCDVPCGRNSFGQTCSNLCSQTQFGCKGMILCTPEYGCTCASGYHGDKCLQECQEGYYGADCKQRCFCSVGCDKYTGHCQGQCDSPYLIWPSCQYNHSYWTDSPIIKDSNFTTIRLSLDFNSTNVKKCPDETLFFMVQYKEATETSWNNGSYEAFNFGNIDYEVDELKSGRKYIFRVLLVDKSTNTNDPDLSQTATGITKCKVSKIDNDLHVTKVTDTSVSVAWNKETESDGTECPFLSYTVDITASATEYSGNARKLSNITRHNIVIKDLVPETVYSIRLKKSTVMGESPSISNVTVQTGARIESSLTISKIRSEKLGSDVYLEWFQHPLKKTYYIKYKLVKRLACTTEEQNKAVLQMVSTPTTNYTLSLEPSGQYVVFVTTNATQETSLKHVTVTSGGKVPSVSPQLLLHKMKTTNETTLIYWTDPASSCTQMNGFFKKHMIQLLDNQNTTLKTYHTKKKQMEITKLLPKTEYTIRIRYVNHIGFNPHDYTEQVFTTKATSSLSPQNLTAYKTTASFIGLRWKMPASDTSVTGTVVHVQNHIEKHSFNVTDLSSRECKAWPSYVCFTVQNLRHNTKYEISVDMLSEEFPEGGSQATIQATTRETMASPVTEIKVADISLPNVTLSWKIPHVLNGVLRKFQIEIEHLSSFDDSLCCQGVSTITHFVQDEQEFYSHVLDNFYTASSYQVTIRAFTRRLGQEASKIIETPPPLLPMREIPQVTLHGTQIELLANDMMDKTSNNNSMSELATDILIIVQSNSKDDPTQHELGPITSDVDSLLDTKHWWIAHVCEVNADCSVHLGTNEERDTPYGKVENKPPLPTLKYTIVAAQINKHLSARSYTVVTSAPFVTNSDSVTTAISEDTSTAAPLGHEKNEKVETDGKTEGEVAPTPIAENGDYTQEDTD